MVAPPGETGTATIRLACLLFDEGALPGADAVAALAGAKGPFHVSQHGAAGEGWLELLRDGLTFDLEGLADGPFAASGPAIAAVQSAYGLRTEDLAGCRALTLAPGPHLAGAERLLPVVRTAAAVAAAIAALPGLRAVAWLPAATAVPGEWFVSLVDAWIDGGAFPALAMSALERDSGGALVSRGLGFLGTSDFRFTGREGSAPDAEAKAAIRLADWLVAHGEIESGCDVELAGVGIVRLRMQPGLPLEARWL